MKFLLFCLFFPFLSHHSFASIPEDEGIAFAPKTAYPTSYLKIFEAGVGRSLIYGLEYPATAVMDQMARTGKSTTKIVTQTIAKKGLPGLWTGGQTILVRGAAWVPRLAIYQSINRHTSGWQQPLYTAGAMTAMDTFLLTPANALRIAMTTATREKPFSLHSVLRPKVLYKDFRSIGLSNLFSWSVYLGADAYFRALLKDSYQVDHLNLKNNLLIGSLTTGCVGMIISPLRLVNITLQAPGAQCSGFWEGTKESWRKLGFKGTVRFCRINTIAYWPGNIAMAVIFNWLDCQKDTKE